MLHAPCTLLLAVGLREADNNFNLDNPSISKKINIFVTTVTVTVVTKVQRHEIL